MKRFRVNTYDLGSTAIAWAVLGIIIIPLLVFQSRAKPTSAPSQTVAPISQLSIEYLPVREEIQPEIQPQPEIIPPPPQPEKKPKLEPLPEEIPEPIPQAPAIPKEPLPEPQKEEPPPPAPLPEPETKPVAVAQEAATVESSGQAYSPTLLQELQKMVEQAKYYPSRARRSNITGRAILQLTIDPAGIIQQVKIISSSHRYLAIGAKKTGMRLKGKTVSSPPEKTIAIQVPISYELR